MTDLATNLDIRPRVGAERLVVAVEPVAAPAFITEREILLGSAAALAGPQIRRRGLRATIRGFFVHTDATASVAVPEKADRPRSYPQHCRFIEDASMAREMLRL
jgi:hypothetical protein